RLAHSVCRSGLVGVEAQGTARNAFETLVARAGAGHPRHADAHRWLSAAGAADFRGGAVRGHLRTDRTDLGARVAATKLLSIFPFGFHNSPGRQSAANYLPASIARLRPGRVHLS